MRLFLSVVVIITLGAGAASLVGAQTKTKTIPFKEAEPQKQSRTIQDEKTPPPAAEEQSPKEETKETSKPVMESLQKPDDKTEPVQPLGNKWLDIEMGQKASKMQEPLSPEAKGESSPQIGPPIAVQPEAAPDKNAKEETDSNNITLTFSFYYTPFISGKDLAKISVVDKSTGENRKVSFVSSLNIRLLKIDPASGNLNVVHSNLCSITSENLSCDEAFAFENLDKDVVYLLRAGSDEDPIFQTLVFGSRISKKNHIHFSPSTTAATEAWLLHVSKLDDIKGYEQIISQYKKYVRFFQSQFSGETTVSQSEVDQLHEIIVRALKNPDEAAAKQQAEGQLRALTEGIKEDK